MEVHDKQKIDQFNHCFGTAGDAGSGPGGCLNGGQNGFFILASGNGSILADVQRLILEQNFCREGVALCINPLSNQVTLREQDQGSIDAKALQKIDVKSEARYQIKMHYRWRKYFRRNESLRHLSNGIGRCEFY